MSTMSIVPPGSAAVKRGCGPRADLAVRREPESARGLRAGAQRGRRSAARRRAIKI